MHTLKPINDTYRKKNMNIGSETGIEARELENKLENEPLDSSDYKFIGMVLFSIAVAFIGILSLLYFFVLGDLHETLNQIAPVVKEVAPVVQATSKK